jgi:hypothetical protein
MVKYFITIIKEKKYTGGYEKQNLNGNIVINLMYELAIENHI